MSKPKLRIGVLFGGRSAEHEVSILSARNVIAALDAERFEAVPIGIARDGRWLVQSVERLLRDKGDPRLVRIDAAGPEVSPMAWSQPAARDGAGRLDVIFPVLHGTQGEDGAVQGLLELAGLPYVGAGVLGSSVGVSRIVSRGQLPSALETAFDYDLKVLVEEAVDGREIECSVLGNDAPVASIPGEIVVTHPDGFYSYDAKYLDDYGATLKIPAPLDETTVREVQRLAIATFRTLECSGLARVDFFLRRDGRLLVNEINTLPGFTAISMYPKLWAASGAPPRELVTRLIDLAMERHAQRSALRSVFSLRTGKSVPTLQAG